MKLPALFALLLCLSLSAQDDAPTEKDRMIAEVVLRKESFDYSAANEKIKAAIGRYLGANAGTEEFFQLIERFKIPAQEPALLKLAIEKAGDTNGARAARLLLASGGLPEEAKKILAGADEKASAALLNSIGAAGGKESIALLFPLLSDEKTTAPIQRAALDALTKSGEGQKVILDLAKNQRLPAALHMTAAAAMQLSSDPKIREEAAAVLPLPASAGATTLPPIAQLVKRTGDPAKGETVFQRICIGCHQVGALGINYGPALTEIGTKLAREAIYTAILDPSAAISFGWEGQEIKMKDGTMQIGFAASETAEELSLKIAGGLVIPLKKADLATRTKMTVSLMPTGLQATMTEVELVDLVEYLANLKKH